MDRDRTTPNRDHPASSARGSAGVPVSFAPLRLAEIPLILAIEQRCFKTPWSGEAFREVLTSPSFQTLGARRSPGELVGYVVFLEVADEVHILNVAVHPSYRRQYIGERMMSEIHRLALKNGRVHGFLEVRESNQPAQALYKKFGYKAVGRRKDYYPGDREAAIVMAAVIKEEPK